MKSLFRNWQWVLVAVITIMVVTGAIFTEDPMEGLSEKERQAAYTCRRNLENLHEGDFVQYRSGQVFQVLQTDRYHGRLALRDNYGKTKTIITDERKSIVNNWREIKETFQRRYLNEYMLKDVMDDFEKQH